MRNEDIHYEYDSRGYMLYYKGKPIGGAGISKDSKGCSANLKLFREQAELDKRNLLSGNGSNYYIEQIKIVDEMIPIEEKREKIRGKIIQLLETKFLSSGENGYYKEEIYPDYRDEMSEKTAGEILLSTEPEMTFYENLYDWYSDQESDIYMKVIDEVKDNLSAYEDLFPFGFDEDDFVEDFIRERLSVFYPEEHFLSQEFNVNVMIDTGDGNYDFTLNSVYPCWRGRYGETIDDKASIVWLAKTQGYTKTQLKKALQLGDVSNPKGFLKSMQVELEYLPSSMSTITFLTRMTFKQLLEINRAIRWSEKDGRIYDARKKPTCGYVILSKDSMCGLYDPWSGGGSVLEIQLEKDVKLPIRYIRSALPDGGHLPYEYSLGEVYGMCGSAWRDTTKKVFVPKKVT